MRLVQLQVRHRPRPSWRAHCRGRGLGGDTSRRPVQEGELEAKTRDTHDITTASLYRCAVAVSPGSWAAPGRADALLRMDLNRVKYLLRAYHRVRLTKVRLAPIMTRLHRGLTSITASGRRLRSTCCTTSSARTSGLGYRPTSRTSPAGPSLPPAYDKRPSTP